MALFGKKDKPKKTCPICGGELHFFTSLLLADNNEICADCAQKMRDQFNVEYYWERKYWRDGDVTVRKKSHDLLQDLTLEEVMEIMAQKEEDKQETLQTVDGAAGAYASVFTFTQPEQIFPKPLQVGIPRAKALKGAWVCKGTAIRGSFEQGDDVLVLAQDGTTRPAKIAVLIPCDIIDFWTELQARTHKKTIAEGFPAWIVLDPAIGEVREGETIVK